MDSPQAEERPNVAETAGEAGDSAKGETCGGSRGDETGGSTGAEEAAAPVANGKQNGGAGTAETTAAASAQEAEEAPQSTADSVAAVLTTSAPEGVLQELLLVPEAPARAEGTTGEGKEEREVGHAGVAVVGLDDPDKGVLVGQLERSFSCMTEEFMSELEEQAPGFWPSLGGEELRRAFATLGGTTLLTPATTERNSSCDGGRQPGRSSRVPVPPLPVREVEDDRSRELIFAAKRYDAATISDPDDFHAAYNHGLVLQELASGKGRRPADQEKLLLQACECYGAALTICRGAHAVLYNWGVALTDLATLAKVTNSGEHRNYLYTAGEKYAAALRWNPNNPQALNNLGLVLQDLAQGLPCEEQQKLMDWAAAKFRRAIRQRPDFHRAAYNLGTVFYAHAAALGYHQWPSSDGPTEMLDATVQTLFQTAAQYVCLAYALQPFKEVYQRSLNVVRTQLPLPFLRSGYLLSVRPGTSGSVKEAWIRNWFVMNESFLTEVTAPKIEEHKALRTDALLAGLTGTKRQSADAYQPAAKQPEKSNVRIHLHDVLHVQRCYDPSLPAGGGFWMQLKGSSERGLYLVAENDEEAECWVDALLLGAFLVDQKREEALGKALRMAVDAPSELGQYMQQSA